MLIRLRIENFYSFREKIELSLIASKERIHRNHVIPSQSRNDVNLLRAAAIYGANASGKSNLIKALNFASKLILRGTKPDAMIPTKPFRLDKECLAKPSRFEFEFKMAGQMYEYGFIVDSQKVHREWLSTLTKTSETKLFVRETDSNGTVKLDFGPFSKKLQSEDRQILDFLARTTRINQLFLTECRERNVTHFQPAYDWFKKVLTLVGPESDYRGLERRLSADEAFKEYCCLVLKAAGTGITSIQTEEIDLADGNVLPGNLRRLIEGIDKADMGKRKLGVISQRNLGPRFEISMKENQLRALKLMTTHSSAEQENAASFEFHEESDGTQRLFHLIPILYELVSGSQEKVYIVDEVGRSLHAHLSYMLMKMHLESGNKNNSQLIITTHETHLLDLDLLRRDEIWFLEKERLGGSTLYSLSEFQPRYDKDIRRDYLIGRYGAIPFIGNVNWLRPPALSMADQK